MMLMSGIDRIFKGRRAVLVTMHGKENAIRPPLNEQLGLVIETISNIDTDQFGTFTGEIKRRNTQYQAAIQKAQAGMAATGCDLGLASEGSFNPDPGMPWLTVNRELVVLVDHRHDWVLEGWSLSVDTSTAQQIVYSLDEALAFGQRVGFPAQGLVARLHANDTRFLIKGINTSDMLCNTVERLLQQRRKGILLETDLRAHMNPKRLAVIRQAAEDLATNASHRCPQCGAPGIRIVEVIQGRQCAWCGTPTDLSKGEIYGCVRCNYRKEHAYSGGKSIASPEYCSFCNI